VAKYNVEPFVPKEHAKRLTEIWAGSLTQLSDREQLEERVRWLYESHPRGPTITQLCRHEESGAIVGSGSALSRRLHRRGQVFPAALLGDLAVEPKHRTAGPAVKILRSVVERGREAGHDILYGLPNDKSAPIFKRLRFKEVGRTRTWRKPLRSAPVLGQRLPSPGLARLLAPIVDTGHRAYDWSTRLGDLRRYRSVVTPRADETFDALWERLPHPNLTGEKTARELNWRYADFVTLPHAFFRLYGGPDRRELIGFVAYFVVDGRVTVTDLFCDYRRDLRLLLFSFCEQMRRQKHSSITVTYFGHRFVDEALTAQNFFLREGSLAFYVTGSVEGLATKDENTWSMFEGDLDI